MPPFRNRVVLPSGGLVATYLAAASDGPSGTGVARQTNYQTGGVIGDKYCRARFQLPGHTFHSNSNSSSVRLGPLEKSRQWRRAQVNACSLQGGAPGLRTWSIGGVSAACLAAKGRTRTPDGPRSEELPLAA